MRDAQPAEQTTTKGPRGWRHVALTISREGHEPLSTVGRMPMREAVEWMATIIADRKAEREAMEHARGDTH